MRETETAAVGAPDWTQIARSKFGRFQGFPCGKTLDAPKGAAPPGAVKLTKYELEEMRKRA